MALPIVTSQSLEERLQGQFRQLLKAEKCLSKKKGQIRSVHRMRVLSRRIQATLNLFPVNGTWSAKIGKQARQLRKNLRDVREIDVFQLLLASLSLSPELSSKLERHFDKKRGKAFEDAIENLSKKRIKFWMKKAAKIHLIGRKPIQEKALVERHALHLTKKILNEPRDLHRLRIDVKYLRYSLEALITLLHPRQGDGLAVLKTIQADLGQIHDKEMLRDYLKTLEKKKEERWNRQALQEVRQLRHRLNGRIRQERKRWEHHWPEHRRFLIRMREALTRGNNS